MSQRHRVAPRAASFLVVARPMPLAAPLFGVSFVCRKEDKIGVDMGGGYLSGHHLT